MMSGRIYALVGLLGMGLVVLWHFVICSEWKGIFYKIFTILLIAIAAAPFFMPIINENLFQDVLNWLKALKW